MVQQQTTVVQHLVPVATLQRREGRHRRLGPRRGTGGGCREGREGAEEERTGVEGEEEGWRNLAAVQRQMKIWMNPQRQPPHHSAEPITLQRHTSPGKEY